MTQSEFIKELEEIISYFEEDGMYALKGLKDYVKDLKKIQIVKKKDEREETK